jgi:hypothetical protein
VESSSGSGFARFEGVPAASIEQASSQAGYPAPVLQLSDELNLKLMRKIRNAAIGGERHRQRLGRHPSEEVVDRMLDERPGRLEGAGFYEYEDGKRTRLWPGLKDAFGSDGVDGPFADLKERMLFIESIQTVKCLADANIGSILGIGFPGWMGACCSTSTATRAAPPASWPPRPRAGRALRRRAAGAGHRIARQKVCGSPQVGATARAQG